MPEPVRVRFAPSPTGYLHVGGARTALFNWLFARGQGGTFVLRIEDTDRERSSATMVQAILEGLAWLGLEWDEGPFFQADGLARHQADVERLVAGGSAYLCFCSPEALQARREAAGQEAHAFRYDRACAALPPEEVRRRREAGEAAAVRFHVPAGETAWDDVVHGATRFANEDLEDFVVLRSDGTPTYNLAVVSDDVEMRISHVIRGDDHLSNTPKQILLYRALGAPEPVFAHLPMILGPDGKRLSKRHGATAVAEYAEQGILAPAMANFLALLGWNPGDDREVMSVPELIAAFSLERVNRKSAVFDPAKLLWLNGVHLSRTPAEEVLALVRDELVAQGLLSEPDLADRHDWLRDLMELLKTRGRTPHDVVEQARAYLAPTIDPDPAAVAKHWNDAPRVVRRLAAVRAALRALEPWEPAAIEDQLRAVAEAQEVSFGKIVHPLRLALVGSSASPGIDRVVAAMGREMVLRRLDAACAQLARQTPAEENS